MTVNVASVPSNWSCGFLLNRKNIPFFNCCDCPTQYDCMSLGRYEIQSATSAYMVTRFGFSQLFFGPHHVSLTE